MIEAALHHPWVRLVLAVLAAAGVGALAARIAGPGPGGPGATAPADGASGEGGGLRGDRSGGGGGSDRGGSGGGGVSVSRGGGRLTVHVTGAVRRPGVYELRDGARVQEAVRKAGGTEGDADREGLNLAAEVRDGQQVLVPERATRAAGGGGDEGGEGGGADAPVDLNSAGLAELDALDGVGPATAEKILALREERGGLGGVDDLDEIPGIGPKRLEALRGQLGG